MKCGVQDESHQGDESKIGTGRGLDGVGGECVVLSTEREFALLPCEYGHDQQSGYGNGDSEGAGLGLKFTGDGKDRGEAYDRGKYEEQGSGSLIDSLSAEAGSNGYDDKQGGKQFYDAVCSKGQKRRAVGACGGDKRDCALDQHPEEGEGLQQDQVGAAGSSKGGHGMRNDTADSPLLAGLLG